MAGDFRPDRGWVADVPFDGSRATDPFGVTGRIKHDRSHAFWPCRHKARCSCFHGASLPRHEQRLTEATAQCAKHQHFSYSPLMAGFTHSGRSLALLEHDCVSAGIVYVNLTRAPGLLHGPFVNRRVCSGRNGQAAISERIEQRIDVVTKDDYGSWAKPAWLRDHIQM